jgi:hypothetical protein
VRVGSKANRYLAHKGYRGRITAKGSWQLNDGCKTPLVEALAKALCNFRRLQPVGIQIAPEEEKMFVRLKIEDTREGLVATISQRDDDGKVTGRPSIFLVGGKEEAKERAKAVARALGLKTYRVLDRTSSRMSPPIHPA